MMDAADMAAFRELLWSWIQIEQHGMREPRTFARWFAQRDMTALWRDVRATSA